MIVRYIIFILTVLHSLYLISHHISYIYVRTVMTKVGIRVVIVPGAHREVLAIKKETHAQQLTFLYVLPNI